MKKKPSIEDTYVFMQVGHLRNVMTFLDTYSDTTEVRAIQRTKTHYYVGLKNEILKFKIEVKGLKLIK